MELSFLSVWRCEVTYDRRFGNVSGWICSIVRERALERLNGGLRSVYVRLAVGEEPVPSGDARHRDPASTESVRVLCRAAHAALPAQQREAIELAYFAGCSPAEIGHRLHVSREAARSLISLALGSLPGARVHGRGLSELPASTAAGRLLHRYWRRSGPSQPSPRPVTSA